MRIPLPRGAYAGRSSNVNAQVVQNLYPELDQEGGKSVLALYGTPGMVPRATLNAGAVVRGLYPIGSVLYGVAGSKLYSVSTSWVVTELGDLDTSTGPVYFDDDGTYLALADRTSGYTYKTDTSTFAKVTDGDFIGANAMRFKDGYFLTCKDKQFQYSDSLNPTSWQSANVVNVRGRSDDFITLDIFANYVWCFKERSLEIYYNSGNNLTAFDRYPGGFYEMGLVGSGAFCQTDDFLYTFTDDREWYRVSKNLQMQKISTVQLDYQFSTLNTVSDAFMYASSSQAGHKFVVLTFPTDSKTYVYDEVTGLFHTRASYDSNTGTDIRHWSNCYAYFNGFHVVGHYSDGKIYALELDTYTDDTSRIRRVATFPSVHDPENRKKLRINRVEVEFEAGVGLTGGVQGEDPQAMLDYSKDGGHAFSNERWSSMGKIGKYENRAIWRRCGTARDFIPRVTITDPVKVAIISANARVERLLR